MPYPDSALSANLSGQLELARIDLHLRLGLQATRIRVSTKEHASWAAPRASAACAGRATAETCATNVSSGVSA